MKIIGLVSVLLVATLVPPPGHGARRGHTYPAACPQALPQQHLQPLRIVRSPQQPKLVRVVR